MNQVMVYSLFYSINALYYEAHLPDMSWVLLCFSAILPLLASIWLGKLGLLYTGAK